MTVHVYTYGCACLVLLWVLTYCFLDCQTILNFCRSFVLNSSCVPMIKSQYEEKHDYRTEMDVSTIWQPVTCHKWELSFHCIIEWFLNFQSLLFNSVTLHCFSLSLLAIQVYYLNLLLFMCWGVVLRRVFFKCILYVFP